MSALEDMRSAAFLAGVKAGQDALWDALGDVLFHGQLHPAFSEELCDGPCGDDGGQAHTECWTIAALLAVHMADKARAAEAWAKSNPVMASEIAAVVDAE